MSSAFYFILGMLTTLFFGIIANLLTPTRYQEKMGNWSSDVLEKITRWLGDKISIIPKWFARIAVLWAKRQVKKHESELAEVSNYAATIPKPLSRVLYDMDAKLRLVVSFVAGLVGIQIVTTHTFSQSISNPGLINAPFEVIWNSLPSLYKLVFILIIFVMLESSMYIRKHSYLLYKISNFEKYKNRTERIISRWSNLIEKVKDRE